MDLGMARRLESFPQGPENAPFAPRMEVENSLS